jgi:hypothetical protein
MYDLLWCAIVADLIHIDITSFQDLGSYALA